MTTTVLLILSTSLYADKENGKVLFDNSKCLECHNIEDFKDKDLNKVKTFKEMKDQVFACSIANDAMWFDDEVYDVSTYLNHEYYHFKQKEQASE